MTPQIPRKKYQISIDPDQPVYIIGVVSEMVAIPIWTLRKLDELKVVCPKRINNKIRCYSLRQLEILAYINYLMLKKGVNISGIKVILEIERKI